MAKVDLHFAHKEHVEQGVGSTHDDPGDVEGEKGYGELVEAASVSVGCLGTAHLADHLPVEHPTERG